MNVMTNTAVQAVEFAGCHHTCYLSKEHVQERERDHQSFYCSICGKSNYFPAKSDLEILQGRINNITDMLDTAREQRDAARRQTRAQKAVTTRIKNRISKGVCLCCKRTFENLAAHMACKHPNYSSEAEKQ